MRRAESIIDIDIGQRGKSAGENRIVVFLFGMKAQVFKQNNSRIWITGEFLSFRANAIGRQDYWLALETFPDTHIRVLG